jgi:diadenosine tetraphosphate (Ap4A) HIT family hydrolase
MFILHANLQKKVFVVDLPLCHVLLEDDKHYPWLFLVPRRNGISRIMELSDLDQLQLLKELDLAQKVLWQEFQPTQLNVAAIGNKTAQLHVHVIARYENDPAWPHTVWDHPVRAACDEELKNSRTTRIKNRLAIL